MSMMDLLIGLLVIFGAIYGAMCVAIVTCTVMFAAQSALKKQKKRKQVWS